jgi:hypothetical protein
MKKFLRPNFEHTEMAEKYKEAVDGVLTKDVYLDGHF